MEFEIIHEGDLGAPVEDIAQEAVDAAATTYTNAPDIDVQQHLREQLHSRGLRATTEATLDEIAATIRSGHPVELGEHDGSIGEPT
jgi:hypothetical protein